MSVSTMAACAIKLAAFCDEIVASLQSSTLGSIQRMMIFIPITIFCVYHQLCMHYAMRKPKWSMSHCYSFTITFILLSALTETLVIYVNDAFPEHEGCLSCRFRCPYSFSSPKFCIRAAVLAAIVVFFLTPCVSFVHVLQLVLISCGMSRAVGFITYSNHITLSLWTTTCMFYQICIFLGSRYFQERHDRKKFLLQLHISELRSNLRDLLDGMMPRVISQRAQAGELVLDYCKHATVLFCSFQTDALPNADPLGTFLLLDQVHQRFDDLVENYSTHAFKVDFVGTDFMVSSPVHSQISNFAERPDTDRAHCVALGHLALRMAAAASRILTAPGPAPRFAIASGPVMAAVMGERRRHLRLLGQVVDAAHRQCELAQPWQVLAAGWAADTLRSAGFPLIVAAGQPPGCCELRWDPVIDVCGGLAPNSPVAADATAAATIAASRDQRRPAGGEHGAWGQLCVGGVAALHADREAEGGPGADSEPGLSVAEALEELAEATGRLAGDGDAALADPAEERHFLLETGDDAGPCPAEEGGAAAAAARTALVVGGQALAFAALAAHGALPDAAWAGGLWPVSAAAAAACLGATCLLMWAGAGGAWRALWAVLHAGFLFACVGLAHARAEPALLQALATGVSLLFVAPPCTSATAAGRLAGGACAAFLAAFAAASWRDGLSLPGLGVVLPLGLLAHCLAVWLRQERRAARVRWVLDGRRRRERAALWAALRDLLPESMIGTMGQDAQMRPHVMQARLAPVRSRRHPNALVGSAPVVYSP